MIQALQHDISMETILVSVIMYGIVRGIWIVIKFIYRLIEKRMETEAGRIIQTHIKSGHNDRLKHCIEDACATFKLETEPGSTRQMLG